MSGKDKPIQPFYSEFVEAYLGPWSEPRHARHLKNLYQLGFEYDDNVRLLYRPLLHKLEHVERDGSTFVFHFSPKTDPKLNSDCLGASMDFLRVFWCEHGLAASFDDATSMLGEVSSEFSALIAPDGAPGTSHKICRISLDPALQADRGRCEEIMSTTMGVMPTLELYATIHAPVLTPTRPTGHSIGTLLAQSNLDKKRADLRKNAPPADNGDDQSPTRRR